MNLSARDLAPKNKGQIKTTLHTRGRRGKLNKVISVETNDPNHPLIKLILSAMVEVELFADPVTVYFKDMDRGEKRLQKVALKNTTQNTLQISSIDSNDKMIMIELVNHSPEWPINLKPNASMDLLVSFRYQFDKPRFSKQIKISYAGGKANEALFRVYATLKPEAQRPAKQTESVRKNLEPSPKQNAKPISVEKPPVDQAVQEGATSLPSDFQSKKGIKKPEEKGPEKDIFSY